VEITATTAQVKNFPAQFRIIHDPDYGMDEWLKKVPRFVLLVPHEKIAQGRKVGAVEAFLSFFLEFIKVYRKSWRGGKVSYLYCLLHGLNRALIKVYIYQYYAFARFNQRTNPEKLKGEHLG
jgi:phosphoribosyl 1,2-cyclic phosphodiesterase